MEREFDTDKWKMPDGTIFTYEDRCNSGLLNIPYELLAADEWYYHYDVDVPGGWRVKVCKLTLGQIEGLLHLLMDYRSKKNYKNADYIKKRLISVGKFHFLPERFNRGNLSGHIQDHLEFKIDKERVTLEGYILEERNKDKPGIIINFFYEVPII